MTTTKPSYADLARAPPKKKLVRRKDAPVESSDSEDPWAPAPYQYKRPKPRVLTGGLFLWEEVASFCEPKEVCKIEAVSADIRVSLQESRKGTRVMNRYWNAQWTRLLWSDSEVPTDKKLLLPSSLTRSEGKKNWKRAYVEEYPAWVQRTFQGVGIRNNATNEAKVLFRSEQLNKHYSAEQLHKMELTVEEAMAKAQAKRGVVTLDGDETAEESASGAANGSGAAGAHKGAGSASGQATGNGKPLVRKPVKDLSQGYSRDDYKSDPRAGTRKGKHKKGGDKKWSGFASMEEDYGDF